MQLGFKNALSYFFGPTWLHIFFCKEDQKGEEEELKKHLLSWAVGRSEIRGGGRGVVMWCPFPLVRYLGQNLRGNWTPTPPAPMCVELGFYADIS